MIITYPSSCMEHELGNGFPSIQIDRFSMISLIHSLFVWLVAGCWWLVCSERKVLLAGG
jgi:hypothetical protein